MSNAEEHAAAIAALNETALGGRTIYVSESLPKDKVGENKKRDPKKKSKFVVALEDGRVVSSVETHLTYLFSIC